MTYVIVADLSCWSRNVALTEQLAHRLDQHGVRLVVANDPSSFPSRVRKEAAA